MESKFYTPSIEEFHVGFEFQERYNGEWNDQAVKEGAFSSYMGSSDIEDVMYELSEGNIRVKHLDREDIESLGWEKVESRGMSENNGYLFRIPQPEYEKGYYHLQFWKGNGRVAITAMQGKVFDGFVKNKSELKRLMKQLGIND